MSNPFDQFDAATPQGDSNPFDQFDAGKKKDSRSAVGEIANQFKAGILVDLPKMAGQALKYTSDPGNKVYEAGQGITDWANEQGKRPDLAPQEDQHNIVTNALASGARMIPQSVAPAAAVGAGILALPASIPATVGLGAASVLGAVPAAMSQGQETLEKAREKGIPEDQALAAARSNALIEGGGEALGTYAGGKLLGIAGKTAGKMFGRTAGDALADQTSTAITKPFLKQLGETALVETGTEIGQNAGEAAVENAYGIDSKTPYQAGKEAIAPTLGMTALLAPFGLAGFAHAAKQRGERTNALASAETTPEDRQKIAGEFAAEIGKVDKNAAANFMANAQSAIDGKQALSIGESMFEPPTPAEHPGETLALPAPTYTGTPSEQMLQAEVERQNQVDAAQKKADALYAERAAFEQSQNLGIAAAPVIPVVGTLSAAANLAVQSGAHAAAVAQQAAAQAAQNTIPEGKASTPAEAQPTATTPASGTLAGIAAMAPSIAPVAPNIAAQAPNIEGRPYVAQTAQVAKEAPQANATKAGATAAQATSQGQGIDLSNRTHAQLNYLSKNGKNGHKEAAIAELQRRGKIAAPKASAVSESVPALKAEDSADRPNGDGYEQRNASRVSRINKANTQEEFDAITAEEHSDGERHFEGTERVRSTINDRKFALKIEAAKNVEASRYEAGDWVSVSEHGSRSAAEQEAKDLQRKDPSSEYRLSIGQNDGWSVRKRKKPDATVSKTESVSEQAPIKKDVAVDAGSDPDLNIEKRILFAADSIDKLRKVDVERVLAQGNIDRQKMAEYIKRKRPDLSGEVDDVMAELQPSVSQPPSASPQHVENGKAESATAAVVVESLKKGAANSPLDLRQERDLLLQKVDQAIAAAPTAEEKDAWDSVNQKIDLTNNMHVADTIGYRVFDVPGDGKFKVLNLKEALQRFRERVEASPGFKKPSNSTGLQTVAPWQRTTTGGTEATTKELLDAGEYSAAVEYAKQIGKPLVFGQYQDGSSVTVYTDSKPFEHDGYDDFKMVSARNPGAADKVAWSVIDLNSGLTISSQHPTRLKVIAETHKALDKMTPEQLATAVRSARASGGAYHVGTQGELEQRWLDKVDVREAEAQARADQEHRKGLRSHRGMIADHTGKPAEEAGKPAAPAVDNQKTDYKGFERVPLGNGAFELRDGNMTVRVEPATKGKYQASFRSAKSSPHLIGEQGAVDWAASYRSDATTKAPVAKAADAKREEFIHNGVRIYPANVNVGGEAKAMWGVESFENKAKREAGERYGFGDGLVETEDQAKSAADRLIKDEKAKVETAAVDSETKPKTERLSGNRRDPTKVNVFNPYVDGDVVTIDGKEWQIKNDGGWYLTTTGNWRGEHQTIKKVGAMTDLIRAIEQAATVDAKKQEEAWPADSIQSQFNTMADIDSAITGIYDGTVSLADYKAAFNGLMSNKDAITAELGKMTIPQLHERFGKQPYGRPEKKGEIIERAFEAVRNTFSLRRSYGRNSYTMGPGMYERYQADNLKALTELVNDSTAEDLKAFAGEIGKTRAVRQEKIAGAQDPKTVEDFDNALRLKKSEGMSFAEARMSLTPEQRAEYDRLKGIESRDQRKARADQQKTDVRVAAQTTEGQVVETKHTKTGEPLFVVKAAERVERDVYTLWNATAKRMGGYYSAFRGNGAVPGFQFKTRENADAFLSFIGGNAEAAKEVVQERRDAFADDRSQSAVERLNEMAERLEDRADESLGRERKANTERRARFAASAESAANAEKAMAKTMRRIASAISDGTAKFLDRVRQKAQIEYLTATLRTAKGVELRTKYQSYADQQRHEGEPATDETADYAEFPQYAMMRSDLANLARKMVTLPNMKMLGQRILKVADDTSTVYNTFAKEHLLEVSKFGKADGSGWANFSTLKDAERSIEVSNLAAVAVPLQIKRGEYRIVLSPSEAINRGIWKGDDRKIFLSPEIGEEIVEKLGRLNRKHGKRRGMDAPPEAPWQFENAYNNRKRLAGLGIEQPWEFRAALREFADLKEAPKEADKIKQMERAMIGRKNDGLDFFPTPAGTAQEMIGAAEITEGMSVLEPSAGMGHIAEQIRDVAGVEPDVIEFNGDRRELLEAKGFNVVGSDFMEADGRYDRIIMNPPFSNRRDAEHVQHAYSLLKPGGRLVAIMGEGVFFGQDKKAQAFREWLDQVGGTSEKLQEGTFLDPSLPVNTSTNARMVVLDKPEGMAAPVVEDSGAGNIAGKDALSPADTAIYGMAAEGKSAEDILKFIGSASRNPFYRQLAKLLMKTGIAPSVTVGDGKGWKMNAGEGNKYAAGYNPKSDTISLFRPASAERNMLHELMHAATLKALSGKGMASAQMKALYNHVKKTGKLKGMYGMSDVDEFIAEAFSNPKFQAALKQVAAPKASGALSSAWNWFVRIVKGILGLPANQENALSQALEIGLGVMREDMALRRSGIEMDSETRYAQGDKRTASYADVYQKRADQLDRAFTSMGLETRRESSGGSMSEYVEVKDPNNEETTYKFRVSNHRLPSGYAQPDFDVIADGVEHDGAMWNASGTWIDAVNWISDKTGKEPRGIIKAMAIKRRHELDSARQAEATEREKVKAQYSDQNNRIIAEKIKLSDWLGYLPDESTLAVSGKGKLSATKPNGEVVLYGAKPFGMANSTKTIDDARKYIESAPTPNSAATRLPGAPDKVGMQKRSMAEPAQSKVGAGGKTNAIAISDSVQASAIKAAQKVQDESNAFDLEEEIKSVSENGESDLSSLIANPKYWDAENEEFTDEGYKQVDLMNEQKARDNLRLLSITDLSDLDSAYHEAQYAAMVSILDGMGIEYKDTSSNSSKYLEVGRLKLRFADHANTTRSVMAQVSNMDEVTSLINVAPGEYKFAEALDAVMLENMKATAEAGGTHYAEGQKQTDTTAFRKWFGDSKVVDADGKPLRVFHGTASDITAFDIGRSGESTGNTGFYGAGAYFSEDADYASGFSFWARRSDDQAPNVVPVYLSLKNPAYINITPRSQAASEKSRATAEKIISTMIARGTDQAVVDKLQGFVSENKFEPFMGTLYNALGGGTGTTALLKEAGFDGVTIYGGISGKEKLAEAVAFDPTQIKSAIGNNGDFDPSNPDIRYNVADEGWSVSEQAKETVMRLAGRPMLDPSDPFAAENARLREQDQSLWSKAKKQLRRYLAPGGLLPQSVFAEKIKRDSEFQAVEFDVRHLIGGLEHAVKADFGTAFDKLSKEQMRPITEALAGNVPASLPEATKTAAVAMRQYIDGMSTEYLKIIQQKIDAKMLKALESGKDSDKAQAINEIELFEKIKGNIGRYVHRSYQAFDDPKWFEKVPASVLNASRLYLKQGYMEAGETDAKAAQLAEVTLHEILKNGTAYDSMESFIAESKLGAKDLSVLMRRKEVPAQIRALLGEYQDARLNFTKSATKMGRLIWNTRFLDRVRDIGMGSFFFEGKDRPANATTQIAADGSEVYAPLNGLWTFPEIAQSFKDALGKEQMSDLYRAIVRANGLVKYGKTVLAPTTAMRNWQSAMFFSLANGHFDLTQMKKSISAFREQVSQKATGQDLKYLRHLKQLGVVYDTPYAGEMARLMEDARMEELLSSDKGDAVRLFRKANQLAQGFYTFGDDFWKIIGFENEKAGLMKAGLSLQEAETEAAKRIRDTYPTYSMVGRGVQWLSRFPLAGTFVSFPAEIIRTSGNMLRTVAADLKSNNPKLRELGMKRAAGMVFVSAAFYSLAALSMAMAGVGDDEDEAIRDLAPEWQKNSTFLYLGRDEKGNLRYFDMSFLDPYGYWKRPITAMLRNQPWEDSLASGLRGMLEPFLGADISAKAIFEAVSNAKESGGKVYKENDGAIDQAIDIADHLRKALQPGVVGNVERLVKAAGDVRKSSGQPYSMEDELVALAGWRATTIDPKTALYYRSFDFTDSISEARKTLTDTLRDANSVSPEDIKDAKARAASKQEQAFKEMSRLIGAAEAAGMSKMQIVQTMRLSNISQANIAALMRGSTPDVSITPQLAARAVRQASQMRGPEYAAEVFDRYRQAMAN